MQYGLLLCFVYRLLRQPRPHSMTAFSFLPGKPPPARTCPQPDTPPPASTSASTAPPCYTVCNVPDGTRGTGRAMDCGREWLSFGFQRLSKRTSRCTTGTASERWWRNSSVLAT
ncbi:hypothetical protein SAY87_027453 [Trapa incisa]|uniref:Uncharacterized protein n=1 Tax=Trapa incisa TaxID=236973 RepID=A0AAN7GW53_9MYRT|nr:hypothetical protein SAY87_027453 [Trapa incisa]